MKKIITSLFITALAFSGQATIHLINVSNNTFAPNAISSVLVGDTVRFEQTAGNHNTVSASIPAGAASWNHDFSGAAVFDYKVTVAGNYGYTCTFHAGMVGGFVASEPTADLDKKQAYTASKAYPNPFKAKITLNHASANRIEIFSILGESVKVIDIALNEKTTTLDLSELNKGVYFYVVKNNKEVLETRRIIKSE